MPLEECTRKHTERQLGIWLAWLGMQWERPDRHDYYLMQIATEIKRVLSRKPEKIKLQDAKLKWSKDGTETPLTPEQDEIRRRNATAMSKYRLAMVFNAAGVPMNKIRKTDVTTPHRRLSSRSDDPTA